MKMHILPGDSLIETFTETSIDGEVIVCRECLIDGELAGNDLAEFWAVREKYLTDAYGDAEKPDGFYSQSVQGEFEKLLEFPQNSEKNLWFEYELFCQVNMWFCLFLLKDSKAEIYRVEPIVRNADSRWLGFGGLKEKDLEKCFDSRKKFSMEDISLGADLWQAFQSNDFDKLRELSKSESECFPYLKEVCEAAVEKEKRPKRILKKIIAGGETDFGKVFRKFNESEGVYGFGDLQVKRLFNDCLSRAD